MERKDAKLLERVFLTLPKKLRMENRMGNCLRCSMFGN